MDAESYLHWLGTTDLAGARLGDLKEAVDTVVTALQSETSDDDGEAGSSLEMLQALQAIQKELHAGRVSLERLAVFRQDFLYDADQLAEPAEVVVLERELREIAAGIAAERWRTETYENIEKAIHSFLADGDEDALWHTVDTIDHLLESVSASYRQTAILPKEVTMESTVTHRLLCEGIEEWQAALDLLRDDEAGEEPDWTAVLDRAETGNRLLVAVQIYHSRLQSVLSTY